MTCKTQVFKSGHTVAKGGMHRQRTRRLKPASASPIPSMDALWPLCRPVEPERTSPSQSSRTTIIASCKTGSGDDGKVNGRRDSFETVEQSGQGSVNIGQHSLIHLKSLRNSPIFQNEGYCSKV